MQSHCRGAQRIGRLDGDDMMAHPGESSRVAPGPGADVENATGGIRHQVENRPVEVGERDALILLEKRFRLFGISFRATDPTERHAIPLYPEDSHPKRRIAICGTAACGGVRCKTAKTGGTAWPM